MSLNQFKLAHLDPSHMGAAPNPPPSVRSFPGKVCRATGAWTREAFSKSVILVFMALLRSPH